MSDVLMIKVFPSMNWIFVQIFLVSLHWVFKFLFVWFFTSFLVFFSYYTWIFFISTLTDFACMKAMISICQSCSQLTNSSVVSVGFPVASLGFFGCAIISALKYDTFTSVLQFFMPLFYFFCQINSTFVTMLYNSETREHSFF